ncbi:hypothetical protein AURDEDRAFT_185065 [Auricularia subglabra TFB-10046 SS5]|nr:hypothetical protein AURDEDRAFT_185065 [Auricularia subglabra TFB-10046 SS5]
MEPRREPAKRCWSELLPVELDIKILGFLHDLRDLRNAAAVSRRFNSSAWAAGLFASLSIECYCADGRPEELDDLAGIVQSALRTGRWLGLSIQIGIKKVIESESAVAREVLAVVQEALPVLVYLSLEISDHVIPLLASVLHSSAPHLKELCLRRFDHHDENPSGDLAQIGAFAGEMPKLRSLALENVAIGPDTVPAFSGVRTLRLSYVDVFPDIDYAVQFQRLRCLSLKFHTALSAMPLQPFNLGGVRLQKLVVHQLHDDESEDDLMSSVLRSVKLSDIPVFEHILHASSTLEWSIWHPNDGACVSIRAQQLLEDELSGLRMIVVPEHLGWRRKYQLIDFEIGSPWVTEGSQSLGELLVYLRIDNSVLTSLLERLCPGLSALRTLQIDFRSSGEYPALVWPPDWLDYTLVKPKTRSTVDFAQRGKGYTVLKCPALETVRLFALDKPINVLAREVAFLGRALGQCPRPEQERAALELVGVGFARSGSRDLLAAAFSGVRALPFAGTDSPADWEDGLWDDASCTNQILSR